MSEELDQRLLGATFALPNGQTTGVIRFYGIYYHYRVQGQAQPGLKVAVRQVTPEYLVVRAAGQKLDY
ncbi:hypothetical protein [Lactobacillus selangorensis]|nr:hypothetical protein [Lactobacillus selangorensis]